MLLLAAMAIWVADPISLLTTTTLASGEGKGGQRESVYNGNHGDKGKGDREQFSM